MAEGWARHLHGELLEPHSAGSIPTRVDPRAIRVMREAGVDISDHRSKHFDEVLHVGFDWVVTVCDHANESCPAFLGKVRRLHVGFGDPPRLAADATTEENALEPYRQVGEEIRAFIANLPERLSEQDSVVKTP